MNDICSCLIHNGDCAGVLGQGPCTKECHISGTICENDYCECPYHTKDNHMSEAEGIRNKLSQSDICKLRFKDTQNEIMRLHKIIENLNERLIEVEQS